MRYLSIDFYRGLTLALMLVVNNPGNWDTVYAPLLHADWNGCTPTDLVFPSFLFIIGVSMWFSFEKYGRKPNTAVLAKIGKRTGLLVLLGIVLAWYPFAGKDIAHIRIPGVLQRLGICYGLAAVLAIYCSNRVLPGIAAAILLGYWGLMYWGAGSPDILDLETNLVQRIDLAVLGPNHLWTGKGIPFDPEGLLSNLPATVNVLCGWWAGRIMQRYSLNTMRVVGELLLWGNILALHGVIWDLVFPMNKSLWTSSFVLYTSGLSMIFLGFAVWALDVKNWKRGSYFFLVLGANSLFAYILSGFLPKTLRLIKWPTGEEDATTTPLNWIYQHIFKVIAPGELGSFLYALFFLGLCWVICWLLYRKKIFIKI